MTRILITGAAGLLGLNLALEATQRYDVIGTLHEQVLNDPGFEIVQVDLLAKEVIPRLLDQVQPDWVVNCAAVASLDVAEGRPQLAQRLNAEVPGRLAIETAKRGLRFLQISTDAIFDGSKGNYRETDAPTPISVYGRTKRLAELAVKAAHPQAIIVRPVFFGWSVSGQRSLGEFFINSLTEGRSVQGFIDRLFCPLEATDLAQILLEMLEKDLHGIYHVVSSDHLSKYDFGVAIAKRFDLDANLIQPSETAVTNPLAPRSPNLTMNTARLVQARGHKTPTVAQGIERFHEQFQSGYRDKLLAMTAAPEAMKG